ncbi:MAG TPA: hypothetical protein VHC73_03705 [Vitreimonas sp.]|nr:hypothetical protein [Vitreimonas sp.]
MNAAPSTDPKPVLTVAPVALWRIAATLMQTLYGLFGNPEDVAAQHTFLKREYLLVRTWLRVAEALLRRLLILEAAAFAKPPPPRPRPARRRVRKLRYFYPEKPQDWRVSFRCFSPARRNSSPACGARPAPKRFTDAWPLAERYEAILRVFNNPIPYARRLAKRLYAQPQRRNEVMRAPADAHHKIGGEDWAELTALCESTRCFADSS